MPRRGYGKLPVDGGRAVRSSHRGQQDPHDQFQIKTNAPNPAEPEPNRYQRSPLAKKNAKLDVLKNAIGPA